MSSLLEQTISDVWGIETARGSLYIYLPDGRTQRYQRAINTLHKPCEILVFIPPYNIIQRVAPRQLLERNVLGNNDIEYTNKLMQYVHTPQQRIIRIANQEGKEMTANQMIEENKSQVHAVFMSKSQETGEYKVDFNIPVKQFPQLGWSPFDIRIFNEGGETRKSRHIGNDVVKIILKDGRVIKI